VKILEQPPVLDVFRVQNLVTVLQPSTISSSAQ